MERTCKFIPHRNDRIQCRREILPSNDDKPFCKRHANTLQAQSYSHYEKNDERKTKSPRDEGNTYKKVQIVQNDFGNFEDFEDLEDFENFEDFEDFEDLFI